VCRGFKGITEAQLTELYQLQQKWVELEPNFAYSDNQKFVVGLFDFIENVGSSYFQSIAEFNDYNLTMEIEKITEGLNLIANGDDKNKDVIESYKNNQRDLAIKWCEQFNVPHLSLQEGK